MNFGDIKNIHFVGIGGIGMSGLAEVLAEAGVVVSGCDLKRSPSTDLLTSRGISVTIGHDPAHVREGIDLVVITSAVKGVHPEVDAARAAGVRIMKRSELLGEIVNAKRAVGVSGTHGKTTTSAMIAMVLEEAGLEPTILVGGMVRNLGTNAKNGRGELLVVEADEYDRTFHQLRPEIAVVTNVEADHLEYYGSFSAIEEAFGIFLSHVKGAIVACVDDPAVEKLLSSVAPPTPAASRHAPTSARASSAAGVGGATLDLGSGAPRVVRYGLSENAELRATNLRHADSGMMFDVEGVGFFKLFVPGEHNVRNALAAIGVGLELGIAAATIAAALAKFIGVDRRFQILGDYHGCIVVDDYAHHPTEIRATLDAARRGYPERRIVALFQPHLFSRTRDFASDFAHALRVADVAMVAPIYAAREQPLEGVSARLIADASPGVEFLDRSHSQIVNELRRRLAPNDVFIAMGAGDVHEIAEELVRGTVQ